MSDNALILIVDDEPLIRKVQASVLKADGHDVRTANSGAEALEFANALRPDLIVMDIDMPEMDGIEATEKLKMLPSCWDVPVVFVTGADDMESIERCFKAGAVDYLTKPVRGNELKLRVSTHLRIKALKDELRSREILFRLIGDQSEDLILILNADLNITYANVAVERLVGHDWLLNQPVWDILPQESKKTVLLALRSLTRDDPDAADTATLETAVLCEAGQECTVQLQVVRVRLGEPDGFAYVINGKPGPQAAQMMDSFEMEGA